MINLAILTNSQDAYSETFIQAHKFIPNLNISYYFGGLLPNNLEGYGSILLNDLQKKLYYVRPKKIKERTLTFKEYCLAKSLISNNINIVLAEYGTVGARALPICKYCNIPLIVFFRGYDASVKDVIEKNLRCYKDMFRYASKIMCVSYQIMNVLESLGCPKEKLEYHSSAPSMAFYRVQPEFKYRRFIGIGRFVDKKAPYYTILAFSRVIKKYPDAELILAGEGPLLCMCKNLVRYLKIENNVQFPGVISSEHYANLLKNSLAFLQHSITADNGDSEGTPVSIMEAGAASIPVISTKHAGIPYAVINGETGYLVEEHDVEGMAEMICKIIEDPEVAKKLGIAARNRMYRYFNIDQRLKSLSELIFKIVNNSNNNSN